MLALALLALLAAGPSSPSGVRNPYLREGRSLAGALRYAEALRQLKLAAAVPSDDDDEKVEILRLTARCEVALGRLRDAEDSYLALLALRPEFREGADGSPRILEAFEKAAARHRSAAPVRGTEPSPRVETSQLVPGEPRPPPVEVALPARAPPPTLAPAPAAGPGTWRRPTGWAVLAAGAVAAGTGAVLQARSSALSRQAREDFYADDARKNQDAAVTTARWSIGLFAAGAALGGAGTIVLVF